MRDNIYDFAGIGIGPFNLGLACLTAPIKELKGIFLDRNAGFDWHPGLLFEDARLQTPFLSDLVTLADPTSPFSFLNYVKQQGRIYAFYIRENFFLLRNEYNRYCQWAASRLANLEFNTEVRAIEYSEADRCYVIRARCMQSGAPKLYKARKLVLGTGPTPYLPACCDGIMERAIHASAYLQHKTALQARSSITVVGSGQSAAEIVHDLLQDIDRHGYELNWISRSPRFFPLEYTKLTLEMTSPEYVDYFYHLAPHKRRQLNRQQKQLSKGINSDLINDIFDLLYAKQLNGEVRVNLRTNSELHAARCLGENGLIDLQFFQTEQDVYYHQYTDGLILATGYAYRIPDYVQGINERIRWDTDGRFAVDRYYGIGRHQHDIFVQNAEHHTHGFVTPDLGMACYRNSCIIRQLTGKEYYPVEQRIAFQQFSALDSDAAMTGIKALSA
jgi:lysine N6-hydroxylase